MFCKSGSEAGCGACNYHLFYLNFLPARPFIVRAYQTHDMNRRLEETQPAGSTYYTFMQLIFLYMLFLALSEKEMRHGYGYCEPQPQTRQGPISHQRIHWILWSPGCCQPPLTIAQPTRTLTQRGGVVSGVRDTLRV